VPLRAPTAPSIRELRLLSTRPDSTR
jgi:hypothetical protein